MWTAGLFIAGGSHSPGIENVIVLGQPALGHLLQHRVHHVGVDVFQADDERVREIFHVGPANGAGGRAHLHGLTVHKHPDVLLQGELAQGCYDCVLAHDRLPEDTVRMLHGDVDGVVCPAACNIRQDVPGALIV